MTIPNPCRPLASSGAEFAYPSLSAAGLAQGLAAIRPDAVTPSLERMAAMTSQPNNSIDGSAAPLKRGNKAFGAKVVKAREKKGLKRTGLSFPMHAAACSVQHPEPYKYSSWPEIAEFSLTYDGYAYTGSLEACKALAEWMRDDWRDIHQLPAHLSELRAALFYEQRRARWTDTDPSGADLRYIRALVAAIAVLVKGEPQ